MLTYVFQGTSEKLQVSSSSQSVSFLFYVMDDNILGKRDTKFTNYLPTNSAKQVQSISLKKPENFYSWDYFIAF